MREGEDGEESEIETGREREREARAHSFGFTPLSQHSRCSRATCSVLDREGGQSLRRLSGERASEWELPGDPLLTAPGPCVCCSGRFFKKQKITKQKNTAALSHCSVHLHPNISPRVPPAEDAAAAAAVRRARAAVTFLRSN